MALRAPKGVMAIQVRVTDDVPFSSHSLPEHHYRVTLRYRVFSAMIAAPSAGRCRHAQRGPLDHPVDAVEKRTDPARALPPSPRTLGSRPTSQPSEGSNSQHVREGGGLLRRGRRAMPPRPFLLPPTEDLLSFMQHVPEFMLWRFRSNKLFDRQMVHVIRLWMFVICGAGPCGIPIGQFEDISAHKLSQTWPVGMPQSQYFTDTHNRMTCPICHWNSLPVPARRNSTSFTDRGGVKAFIGKEGRPACQWRHAAAAMFTRACAFRSSLVRCRKAVCCRPAACCLS